MLTRTILLAVGVLLLSSAAHSQSVERSVETHCMRVGLTAEILVLIGPSVDVDVAFCRSQKGEAWLEVGLGGGGTGATYAGANVGAFFASEFATIAAEKPWYNPFSSTVYMIPDHKGFGWGVALKQENGLQVEGMENERSNRMGFTFGSGLGFFREGFAEKRRLNVKVIRLTRITRYIFENFLTEKTIVIAPNLKSQ